LELVTQNHGKQFIYWERIGWVGINGRG